MIRWKAVTKIYPWYKHGNSTPAWKCNLTFSCVLQHSASNDTDTVLNVPTLSWSLGIAWAWIGVQRLLCFLSCPNCHLSPDAVPLFSGWNCVATHWPCRTAQTKRSPYSEQARAQGAEPSSGILKWSWILPLLIALASFLEGERVRKFLE